MKNGCIHLKSIFKAFKAGKLNKQVVAFCKPGTA
jgi:hypothetical protein